MSNLNYANSAMWQFKKKTAFLSEPKAISNITYSTNSKTHVGWHSSVGSIWSSHNLAIYCTIFISKVLTVISMYFNWFPMIINMMFHDVMFVVYYALNFLMKVLYGNADIIHLFQRLRKKLMPMSAAKNKDYKLSKYINRLSHFLIY